MNELRLTVKHIVAWASWIKM